MKQMFFLKNDDKSDDIYIYNFTTKTISNITKTPSVPDGWPMMSYDGKWIYYSSMETGHYCIYRIKPDGSGKEQVTSPGNGEDDARVCISQDGKQLIYNKEKGLTISIYSATL
jgi:TolB protein